MSLKCIPNNLLLTCEFLLFSGLLNKSYKLPLAYGLFPLPVCHLWASCIRENHGSTLHAHSALTSMFMGTLRLTTIYHHHWLYSFLGFFLGLFGLTLWDAHLYRLHVHAPHTQFLLKEYRQFCIFNVHKFLMCGHVLHKIMRVFSILSMSIPSKKVHDYIHSMSRLLKKCTKFFKKCI